MEKLQILNTREIKDILKKIKEQWGADFPKKYAFLMNTKNKIFIVNKDISKIDFDKLKINNLGLYFGEINKGELRLSVDGSQLVGPKAKKNIIELDKGETRLYMRGFDLEKKTKEKGFMIIKHNDDYLGTGKANGEKIFNYTPKERRINA
jgi:NOL1/NOP2/fmu family ribosome biogenesis protein